MTSDLTLEIDLLLNMLFFSLKFSTLIFKVARHLLYVTENIQTKLTEIKIRSVSI